MDDPLIEMASVALDAQEALRSALVSLLEVEELDPEVAARHQAARQARDEAALALGLAVLRALRAGQEVRLVVEVEEPLEVAEVLAPVALRALAPVEADGPLAPVALRALAEGIGHQGRAPRAEVTLTAAERASLTNLTLPLEPQVELRTVQFLVDRVERWVALVRKDEVIAALHLLTARLRRLQAESGELSSVDKANATALIRRLAAIVQESQVAFIHGLALRHLPSGGSWLADARRWATQLGGTSSPEVAPLAQLRDDLEAGRVADAELPRRFQAVVDSGVASHQAELLELAMPHLALLQGSGCCKTLLKRLRERQRQEDTQEFVDGEDLDIDPSVLVATRGLRAVVVGGDERGQARERIQRAFGFTSLEWERGWEIRKAQALAERIRAGSVDCVIMLRRFISHKLGDQVVPACKESEVLIAWVPQGYGVRRIESSFAKAMGLPGAAR